MAVVASLALVACGTGSDSTPGGVSEGEASALDEAAQTLDQQQTLPKGAVPPIDLPAAEQAPKATGAAADAPTDDATGEAAGETSGETSE